MTIEDWFKPYLKYNINKLSKEDAEFLMTHAETLAQLLYAKYIKEYEEQ